ncbi:MAG: phosphatase PAP2 family protein [Thermoleophilia bacterium]|nr:phosphatase PAP2 family protein [Thermoleophilia bacterium]
MSPARRLLLAAGACLLASLAIAIVVSTFGSPAFDRAIDVHAQSLRDGWFGDVMRTLTRWGYDLRYSVLVAIAAALLIVRRRPLGAAQVVVSVLLADVAFGALKQVFQRPRPDIAAYHAGGWSMPSGHATLAFALAAALLLAEPRLRAWWGVLVLGAYASLTAFSRVVLGVHYPTDIVAGALLGCACALLVAAGAEAVRRRPASLDQPVDPLLR